MLLDHTLGFIPAPHLQLTSSEQCGKFFNNDLAYTEDEVRSAIALSSSYAILTTTAWPSQRH
jgi:hypothetical protein